MELDEIRKKITNGDFILVSQLTNYKLDTVKKQIRGERTLKDKTRIAAIKVIENREQLINNEL